MASQRPRYDDKFRASAVVMLEAAGYPNVQGALAQVAKHLGMQEMTLSRWARGVQNPPPNQLVINKKQELSSLHEGEIRAIFAEMGTKREDASYRDLGIVLGIVSDKWQLLNGEPTESVKQSISFERRGISTLPKSSASGTTPGTE